MDEGCGKFDAQKAHEQSPAFPPMYHSGFHAGQRHLLMVMHSLCGLPEVDCDHDNDWYFEQIRNHIKERNDDAG